MPVRSAVACPSLASVVAASTRGGRGLPSSSTANSMSMSTSAVSVPSPQLAASISNVIVTSSATSSPSKRRGAILPCSGDNEDALSEGTPVFTSLPVAGDGIRSKLERVRNGQMKRNMMNGGGELPLDDEDDLSPGSIAVRRIIRRQQQVNTRKLRSAASAARTSLRDLTLPRKSETTTESPTCAPPPPPKRGGEKIKVPNIPPVPSSKPRQPRTAKSIISSTTTTSAGRVSTSKIPHSSTVTVRTCEHFRESVRLSDVKMMLYNGAPSRCTQCSAKPCELWLCLKCGHVGCGESANAHGRKHAEKRQHVVAMRTSDGTCFCFECGVYVSARSSQIASIRKLVVRSKTPLMPEVPRMHRSGGGFTHASSNNIDVEKFKGKTGLTNFGNTCFMNAVVQALGSTSDLRNHILKHPLPPQISTILAPGGSASPKKGCDQAPHRNARGAATIAPRSIRLLQNIAAPDPKKLAMPTSMYSELARLFTFMWRPNQHSSGVCEPASFFAAVQKVMPYFGGYKQHDAHEFLRHITDRVSWEFHEGARKMLRVVDVTGDTPQSSDIVSSASPFSSLFGLSLVSEVECMQCNNVSRKIEAGQDLSLDIPREKESIRICATMPLSKDVVWSKNSGKHVAVRRSSRTAQISDVGGFDADAAASGAHEPDAPVLTPRPCRLVDCLRSFTKTEELGGALRYKCPSCASTSAVEEQKVTKRMMLAKLPSILCLHLKRFHWNFVSMGKVTRHVQFPLRNLSVDEFYSSPTFSSAQRSRNNSESSHADAPPDKRMRVESTDSVHPNPKLFDLYAVVVHHGVNFEYGHYSCYCKNDDGKWYHFNDASVTPVDEEVVARCEAYLLFYRQNA